MPLRMIFTTSALAFSISGRNILHTVRRLGIDLKRGLPIDLHRRRMRIIQRLSEGRQANVDDLQITTEQLIYRRHFFFKR